MAHGCSGSGLPVGLEPMVGVEGSLEPLCRGAGHIKRRQILTFGLGQIALAVAADLLFGPYELPARPAQ